MQLSVFKSRWKLYGAVVLGCSILLSLLCVPQSSKDLVATPRGFNYGGRPFTGVIYAFHANYVPSKLAVLFRGMRHGVEIHWYSNGQRWMERHYRQGLEVGTHRAWYPNGKVKFLKQFVDGNPHGDFFDWHPNGALSQFIRYEKGIEVAAKSWTSGGKPFYNYVWRDGERVGLEGDSYCSPGTIRF